MDFLVLLCFLCIFQNSRPFRLSFRIQRPWSRCRPSSYLCGISPRGQAIPDSLPDLFQILRHWSFWWSSSTLPKYHSLDSWSSSLTSDTSASGGPRQKLWSARPNWSHRANCQPWPGSASEGQLVWIRTGLWSFKARALWASPAWPFPSVQLPPPRLQNQKTPDSFDLFLPASPSSPSSQPFPRPSQSTSSANHHQTIRPNPFSSSSSTSSRASQFPCLDRLVSCRRDVSALKKPRPFDRFVDLLIRQRTPFLFCLWAHFLIFLIFHFAFASLSVLGLCVLGSLARRWEWGPCFSVPHENLGSFSWKSQFSWFFHHLW